MGLCPKMKDINIFCNVGIGLLMTFMYWCKHLLAPFLFHEVTSLHPPSFLIFSACIYLLQRFHSARTGDRPRRLLLAEGTTDFGYSAQAYARQTRPSPPFARGCGVEILLKCVRMRVSDCDAGRCPYVYVYVHALYFSCLRLRLRSRWRSPPWSAEFYPLLSELCLY